MKERILVLAILFNITCSFGQEQIKTNLNTKIILKNGVRIRESTDSFSDYRFLTKRTEALILLKDGDWYKVEIDHKIVWIYESELWIEDGLTKKGYSKIDSIITKIRDLKKNIDRPFDSSIFEKELNEKIQILPNLPKDEFETQKEFEKRKYDATNKTKELRNEYAQKIANAKRKHDEYINELEQEREQLLASSEQDTISSFTLGVFDADTQQFPILLKATYQTFTLPIKLQQARDFKKASSSLQAQGKMRLTSVENYEFYNWKINYNGQMFLIGPQKGKQQYVTLKSQPSLPPQIKASIIFSEPSGNLKLDANEMGEIVVTVTNSGQGGAFGVEVNAKIEAGISVTVTPWVYIGEIPSGQVRTTKIILRAGGDVADGKTTASISYGETNGFAPIGNKVTFETKALVPPKLVLADVGIDDFSKNGKIEPGEIVKITARIQNTGNGNAENVKAKISIGENVFLAGGSQSEFEIGTLESGNYADVNFSIYTNNLATIVPVSISVSESYGKYGIASQSLPLSFNKALASIEEITVKGKDDNYGDIKIASGLSVDVDINIPATTVKNPDAVALVIGISKYKNKSVPSVDYAKHGATIMKEYLTNTLGYNGKRIIYADDENAGKNDFNIMLQKLSNMVRADKSDVFVYYNGHGAPDTKTSDAFFVPYDCDPEYANVSGYPVREFYNQIAKLPARSITVVLDACFSGSTPKGLLFKGVSPALLKVKNPIAALKNGIVFSSSSENQLSNWYPEKKHGLFTYYFLKALQGEADANKDHQLTVEEIENFLNDNVPDKARENNREQTPQVIGDKKRVIVKY